MCVLRVSGKKFDPARFLAHSKLKPYSVFRAGDPRTKPGSAMHDTSGFNVDVSHRTGDNLSGQVADALAFFRTHERSLAKLRSMPDIDDIRLDFPIDLRIDGKHGFAQFEHFPAELVRLAGALGAGLELSIYPRDFGTLARTRRRAPTKSAGVRRRSKSR